MEAFGNKILAVVVIAVMYLIVKGVINGISRRVNTRRYFKQGQNSSGIEKINFLIRSGDTFSFSLKKVDGSSWSNLSSLMIITYINLADCYYGLLKNTYDDLGLESSFDDLAERISSDYTKQKILSSRLFAVTFGIVVAKASILENNKINTNVVKKYLSSCKFDEIYRKEILNTFTTFINYVQDELYGLHRWTHGSSDQQLAKITYSLLDSKINNRDFGDPVLCRCMAQAIVLILDEVSINDDLLSDFKNAGFLSQQKIFHDLDGLQQLADQYEEEEENIETGPKNDDDADDEEEL